MLRKQEHVELMAMFEREYHGFARMDRESKEQWADQHIYQHGELNSLFLAYRRGYAFGRAVERSVKEDGE